MTRSEAFEKLRKTFSSNSEPRLSQNMHMSSSGCGAQWKRGRGPPSAGQDEPPLSHLMRCLSYLRRRVRVPSCLCL